MIDHKNYLFILANQGAGGHRLGRLISKLDLVYWYASNKNGFTPDDTFYDSRYRAVAGKSISEYHYDRLVGVHMVPLVGERIEVWWDSADIDLYYNDIWTPRMEFFSNILETKYLHWILHDIPETLLTRFPNAKVISLIDTDVDSVANRYLRTTARFPAYYRFPGLKPAYENQYAKDVYALETIKPRATVQDLWEYQNPGQDHEQFVRNMLRSNNDKRIKIDHPRHLKITWDDLDLSVIDKFLKT